MLARIEQGHWYKWTQNPSPVMQELIEAGHITSALRAERYVAAFVPIGYKSRNPDQYPKRRCPHLEVRLLMVEAVDENTIPTTVASCVVCGKSGDELLGKVKKRKAAPLSLPAPDPEVVQPKPSFKFGIKK
jgi:hypothetical protein